MIDSSPSIVPHHQTPLTCLAAAAAASSPLLIKLRTVQNRTKNHSHHHPHITSHHWSHTQPNFAPHKNVDFYPIPKRISDSCRNKEPSEIPFFTPMVAGGNYPQQPSLSGAGIVAGNIAQLSCHYNLQLQPELIQFYEVQDI